MVCSGEKMEDFVGNRRYWGGKKARERVKKNRQFILSLTDFRPSGKEGGEYA